MYLDNFPLKGVFSGKEIVENLEFDEKYLSSIDEIEAKTFKHFLIFGTLILLSGIVASFLGNIATITHLVLSIGTLFIFNKYIKFKSNMIKNSFKRPKGFIFTKINFFISTLGHDTSLRDILSGIIKNFDNTILNKKFQKEVSKNG